MKTIAQVRAIESKNKERFLALNPKLDEGSGIYILFREENGIRHAYVGQAKHILTRLAQHLVGYQHIDLSLKKHGLYSDKNPNGYKVFFEHCSISALDDAEREWIRHMASKGYQLKNHTIGGQDDAKKGMDNQKSPRGYRDGVRQGEKNARREIAKLFKNHLTFAINGKSTVHKQNAYAKFKEFITIEEEGDKDEEA
jgi:hypothetical protein